MYGINERLLDRKKLDYADHLSTEACQLDCSLGTNPFGSSPGLRMPQDWLNEIALYPVKDDQVKDKIISYWHEAAPLARENISLFCGSLSGIFSINRMFLKEDKTVLGLAPQFSAVIDDIATYGALYRPFYLKQEDQFAFREEAFLAYLEDHPDAYLYIDNPNNPTGQFLTLDTMEKIIATAKRMNSFVLVDEAYEDYLPKKVSTIQLLDRYDNFAVVKSFSKGMGLAGIRLGYSISRPDFNSWLHKVDIPYTINSVADQILAQSLETNWARTCAPRIEAAKQQLQDALTKIKMAATCSAVPISLLYVEDQQTDLCRLLASAGIRSVPCDGFPGLGKNSVRLNLHPDMQQLIELLQQAEAKL